MVSNEERIGKRTEEVEVLNIDDTFELREERHCFEMDWMLLERSDRRRKRREWEEERE